MPAKENPHELKQERRRRPRSCLSCCFSASPIYESDDLGSTLASRPEPQAHEEAPWFSWPWSQRRRTRRKKKKMMMMKMITVPVSINDSTKSVPAGQGDKDKLHKTKSNNKSNKPRRSNSQVQHQEEELELNSNAVSQSTSLPKISAKYGARSQAAIPPSSMPDPVRTTTRTKHLGSSEPIQLPVHARSSDRPATLDPAVGLSLLGFTLTIMLLCGRTCAIACLCACFYLLPLLRTATRATGGGSTETQKSSVKMDMESEEYKKRVVLEGLLERNGRRLSGLNSGKAPAAN